MKIKVANKFGLNKFDELISLLNDQLDFVYLQSENIQIQDVNSIFDRNDLLKISEKVIDENFDFCFFIHKEPFIDNYFTHFVNSCYFLSLNDWERLASLPESNGIVYFISAFIAEYFDNFEHGENNGCIYSKLEDKRGVDFGMRSAFLCPECYNRIIKNTSKDKIKYLGDMQILLNILSSASRANIDITDYLLEEKKKKAQQKDNLRDKVLRLKETELFPVLVKIFEKMEFNDIRINHGATEFGKDIVFNYLDLISSKKIWTACIIKATDINDNSLFEIKRQLNQAVNIPYPFQNSNVKIDRFLVITNKKLTYAAQIGQSNNAYFSEINANVDIWDLSNIIELLLKYDITL